MGDDRVKSLFVLDTLALLTFFFGSRDSRRVMMSLAVSLSRASLRSAPAAVAIASRSSSERYRYSG
ncbi:hypothetical protein C84B14_15980 [Salinisphaera sp. C84B14]